MNKYLIIGGSSGIRKSIVKKLVSRKNKIYATYHKTTPKFNDENVSYEQKNTESDFTLSNLPPELDGIG